MNNKINLEKIQADTSKNNYKKVEFGKFVKKLKKNSPIVTRETLERKRGEANEAKEASEDLARSMRDRERQFKERIAELEKLLKEKNKQTKELQKELTETEKITKEIEKLKKEGKENINYINLLQEEVGGI